MSYKRSLQAAVVVPVFVVVAALPLQAADANDEGQLTPNKIRRGSE